MWCVSKEWGLGGRCVSDTELQPFAFPFVTRVSGSPPSFFVVLA